MCLSPNLQQESSLPFLLLFLTILSPVLLLVLLVHPVLISVGFSPQLPDESIGAAISLLEAKFTLFIEIVK